MHISGQYAVNVVTSEVVFSYQHTMHLSLSSVLLN